MSVTVVITDGPLPPAAPGAAPGAGAALCFEGIVRPEEDGRVIAGLDYEVYQPMAERQLAALGAAAAERHGVWCMVIEHSRGRVGVGETSFRLIVSAAHRKEAIAALDEFIDRMKRDVPIWKRPEFASATPATGDAPRPVDRAASR